MRVTHQTGKDGQEKDGDGGVAGNLCHGGGEEAEDEEHTPLVYVTEHLQLFAKPLRKAGHLQPTRHSDVSNTPAAKQ